MFPNIVKAVIQAANHAPSADNGQPLAFSWTAPQLKVFIDPLRCNESTYFDPSSQAMNMTVGAAAENIRQLIASNQMQATLDLVANEVSGCELVITFSQADLDMADSVASDVFERHTNRLPFKTKLLASTVFEQIDLVNQKYLNSGLEVVTYTKDNSLDRLLELLRKASMLRFQTRQTNEWLASSLRFTADEVARGDGLDIATLGLPPGGSGLLKGLSNWNFIKWLNKINFHKLMSKIEVQPLQQSAAVLVLKGRGHTVSESAAAGRLLEQLWIMLNQQGVAVHPYYVLTDQLLRLELGLMDRKLIDEATVLAEQTHTLLGGRFPHLILRVGYPTKKTIRSRRYPLQQLLDNVHLS